MSRRASPEPLSKITLKIFAADHDFLRRTYRQGASDVIRQLIRAHIQAVNTAVGQIVHYDLEDYTDHGNFTEDTETEDAND